MKRPFNIFPSTAFKNSQLQIVSSIDNLRIDFYSNEKVIKSINSSSKYPITLTIQESSGLVIAKCNYEDKIFKQEISIKDAFRFGSSELKKTFVYEDSKFSFLLMKDRMHIYNEEKNLLLTENHYSPTQIHKIDAKNFLFLTKINESKNGVVNLGIYDIERFSLVTELLNEYIEIKIFSKKNIAWLFNTDTRSLVCFELISNDSNRYFTKLREYEGFINYTIDETSQYIFIDYNEFLYILDLINISRIEKISKLQNKAIDKTGNIYTLNRNTLTIEKCFLDYLTVIELTFDINLDDNLFIHLGSQFNSQIEHHNLDYVIAELKDDIIYSIPSKKIYYQHNLNESQKTTEFFTYHVLYPTSEGVFLIQKELKKELKKIEFKKRNDDWIVTPITRENCIASLTYLSSNQHKILIDKTGSSINVSDYLYPMLLISKDNKKHLCFGDDMISFEIDKSIKLLTLNEFSYFLVKSDGKYSVFESGNFNSPILEKIEILNPGLIEKHQIIWYSVTKKEASIKSYLRAFDLKTSSNVVLDEGKLQYTILKDITNLKFYENYALSSNQVVFSPFSLEVKDSFVGEIESLSKDLNKIISLREDEIYLSIFNNKTSKYKLFEIPIDNIKYKESHLSPNGKFLVLKNINNKYTWYDIEKDKTIEFISGNFLKFNKDGNILLEQNENRALKIVDPVTFKDIAPANYHYYDFMSPDEQLYAKSSCSSEYLNKLEDRIIKEEEFFLLKEKLREPNKEIPGYRRGEISKNRYEFYKKNQTFFNNLDIDNYQEIRAETFIKKIKYLEIGFANNSNSTIKIHLPENTDFFNYAAFSYDNQFIGIVGKPELSSQYKSLIIICSLKVDYENEKIEIEDEYIGRFASRACWVCGFSKIGYFATYDSQPVTFIFDTNQLHLYEQNEEIKNDKYFISSKTNFKFSSKKPWTIFNGKNFLCFSPSGNFLALSKQGYDPITIGGCGHQESSSLYVAETKTGKLIESFSDHGEHLVDSKSKDTIFVSFSDDEKKLMSMSKDGVVIVRDLNIDYEV